MKYKKAKSYKIIKEYDDSEFENQINSYLAKGWTLHGKTKIFKGSTGPVFYQPLAWFLEYTLE